MDKTAVVSVERRHPHPLYRKIIRTTKRYKAHDPNNQAQLGDVVRLEESRPLSKEKRWRIVETMVQGNVADIAPREIGVPEEATPETQAPSAVAPAEETVADTTAQETEAATETPTAEAEAEAEEQADGEEEKSS